MWAKLKFKGGNKPSNSSALLAPVKNPTEAKFEQEIKDVSELIKLHETLITERDGQLRQDVDKLQARKSGVDASYNQLQESITTNPSATNTMLLLAQEQCQLGRSLSSAIIAYGNQKQTDPIIKHHQDKIIELTIKLGGLKEKLKHLCTDSDGPTSGYGSTGRTYSSQR